MTRKTRTCVEYTQVASNTIWDFILTSYRKQVEEEKVKQKFRSALHLPVVFPPSLVSLEHEDEDPLVLAMAFYLRRPTEPIVHQEET